MAGLDKCLLECLDHESLEERESVALILRVVVVIGFEVCHRGMNRHRRICEVVIALGKYLPVEAVCALLRHRVGMIGLCRYRIDLLWEHRGVC